MKKIVNIIFLVIFAAAVFPPQAQAVLTFKYIVKLSPDAGSGLLKNYGKNIQEVNFFSENFRNIFTFSSVLPISNLQDRLGDKIDYIEQDFQVKTSSVYINDPGFTVDYQNIDKQWGLVKAGFVEAWSQTVGSGSTTVAIIDTGVDTTHEDLQNVQLVDGYNFLTNTPITGRFNSDDNGHGTLVAGVLGAGANNGIGIAGTNWQISIMPLKVLDKTGKGDASAVSQAIIWAVDHGAKIINLSFGGIGFDHDVTLSNAISYAFAKNTLIVAAGGNDVAKSGGNLDQNPVFPICDDNGLNMVIGVGATDQNDLKADFSNYGKGCVDVMAPGKRILSTINFDPVTNKSAPNSYAYASGTSLAVPFVAGEAALIWALKPNLTAIQVRDRIIRSAENIDTINLSQCGGFSCEGLLGAGRINVKKALEAQTDSPVFSEGDLVESFTGGLVYQIIGGQKRPVSAFVRTQRFAGIGVKAATDVELSAYPEGSYAAPLDGTLVKNLQDGTVYTIDKGLKLPVTYLVFKQRGFSFQNVNVVSYPELNSWVSGNFLPPIEGTLVKAAKKKTIFWVVGQTLHPINFQFYKDRGLNIFPVLTVPDADLAGFPKGEAFIR